RPDFHAGKLRFAPPHEHRVAANILMSIGFASNASPARTSAPSPKQILNSRRKDRDREAPAFPERIALHRSDGNLRLAALRHLWLSAYGCERNNWRNP